MRPSRTTPEAGAFDARPGTPPVRGRRAHAGPPADESAERAARAEPGTAPRGGWRLRPRTVRAKVISLLVVPVVSLLALWGFATVSTAQDVARLRRSRPRRRRSAPGRSSRGPGRVRRWTRTRRWR
ncbi:hypothetical protein ACWC1D_36915, partial [Streptomyces sp. NPDC001478]